MILNRRSIIASLIVVGFLGIGTGFFVFNTIEKSKPITIYRSGSIAYESKEDMSVEAPIIVEGTIIGIPESKWNTQDGKEPNEISREDSIYHDVLIQVDNVLKGTLESTSSLRVRVYEGNVPDSKTIKEVKSEGEPKFKESEKVVIFLDYDDSPYNKTKAKDFYVTEGMNQGKYTILGDTASNPYETINAKDLISTIEKHKNDAPKAKPKSEI